MANTHAQNPLFSLHAVPVSPCFFPAFVRPCPAISPVLVRVPAARVFQRVSVAAVAASLVHVCCVLCAVCCVQCRFRAVGLLCCVGCLEVCAVPLPVQDTERLAELSFSVCNVVQPCLIVILSVKSLAFGPFPQHIHHVSRKLLTIKVLGTSLSSSLVCAKVRKIAAHQITASDLNTFTITFLINMRMKFVMTTTWSLMMSWAVWRKRSDCVKEEQNNITTSPWEQLDTHAYLVGEQCTWNLWYVVRTPQTTIT